ncbi:hypothetical protein [Rhodococcus marinonascens]|uniref:hypothetical protein n=1 Tax=Rhodococcus marinonascens TaxID=38311 RepID=UPI000A9707A2|nr:hypothetical protein [Rhodococcus marinonascens]
MSIREFGSEDRLVWRFVIVDDKPDFSESPGMQFDPPGAWADAVVTVARDLRCAATPNRAGTQRRPVCLAGVGPAACQAHREGGQFTTRRATDDEDIAPQPAPEPVRGVR